MHILLTRPLEDSKDLIIRFKELGHQVSHLPVITIEKKDYEDPNYNEFKGIIFTSSNAIKNLDISKINKDIFCFCVGNATEKISKEKGFQNIYTAEGNVSNLKEIIFSAPKFSYSFFREFVNFFFQIMWDTENSFSLIFLILFSIIFFLIEFFKSFSCSNFSCTSLFNLKHSIANSFIFFSILLSY